jgi:isoquinoline 1-oxidoreductase
VVTDDPEQALTYADLLRGPRLALAVPDEVTTKAPEDFRVMGRPARRIDAVDRVTGRAKYSQDIVLPGMLYGKILRPPSYGARLLEIDTTRAERVAGFVSVVREDDFVGVVAEREDQAEYALEAVRARWEEDRDTASDWNLPALLKERAGETVVLREDGSLEAGFDRADRVLESVYFVPYVSNAQMEPSAAVASWEGEQLTVWSGNRSPFGERDQLAEVFGIGQDRVRVIAAEIGGSFGSKTPTVAVEAARLARAVGRPVRVGYSRAEEFAWSTVRPAALIEIRSGVTAEGTIVAWDYTAYHSGGGPGRARRGADTLYDTPNVRVSVANSPSPLMSGSYRSLGGAINHFAREVHLDEIAAALELDPVELRLRNLTNPRLRRALTTAAERFGWESREAGPSEGFGVAVGYDVGSYVAECVELAVRDREVQVRRVVAAFDCGLVVNPDGARNQVEGSIMMGIGTALWEAVEFDGGRVLNAGFTHYRVPRITDAPEIEVVLVGDPETPSSGAGEPGIVPIAAAVANAVRDATGTGIDQLPIVPRLG